jgi:hypothetical protein
MVRFHPRFLGFARDEYQEIVSYPRCWQRGQTLGAERFQKELFAQLAAAQRSASQQRLVALLGRARVHYFPKSASKCLSTRQMSVSWSA